MVPVARRAQGLAVPVPRRSRLVFLRRDRTIIAALIGVVGTILAALVPELLSFRHQPHQQGVTDTTKRDPSVIASSGVGSSAPQSLSQPDQLSHTISCRSTSVATVVICGLIYDPSGPEPDDEQIALCNEGPSSVDLTGWSIRDNSGLYILPHGTRIESGTQWVVFGTTFNPTRYTHGVYLSNKGDLVRLFDNDGTEVDCRSW